MIVPNITSAAAEAYVIATKLANFSVIEVITDGIAYHFYINKLKECKPFGTFVMSPFESLSTNSNDALVEYNGANQADGFCSYTNDLKEIVILKIAKGSIAREFYETPRHLTTNNISINGFSREELLEKEKTIEEVEVHPSSRQHMFTSLVPFEYDGSNLERVIVSGTIFDDKNTSLEFLFDVAAIKIRFAKSNKRKIYAYSRHTLQNGTKMYCRAACIFHNDALSMMFYTYGRVKKSKLYGTVDIVKGAYYGNI